MTIIIMKIEESHNQSHQIDFSQSFSDAPVFLAAMQSYAGGDAATVRLREALTADQATVFIEEERSHDSEMRHNAEDVGYLAVSSGDILGDDQDGDELSVTGLVNVS